MTGSRGGSRSEISRLWAPRRRPRRAVPDSRRRRRLGGPSTEYVTCAHKILRDAPTRRCNRYRRNRRNVGRRSSRRTLRLYRTPARANGKIYPSGLRFFRPRVYDDARHCTTCGSRRNERRLLSCILFYALGLGFYGVC